MMLNNQKGLATVDYMFSLVLVSGFAFIIFALSLTLTVVEVLQYATYSSARNYFAADLNEESQRTNAFMKYVSLVEGDALKPLLSGGWFEVQAPTIATGIGDQVSELSDYSLSRPDRNTFHGMVIYFVSKVLEFNIPFYGSTVSNELRGGEEFGAYIGSYLGREVTQQECENFLRLRWEKIKLLPTGGAAAYSEAKEGDNNYVGFADNGC